MNIAFSAEDSEAVLLVNASNVFNSLNHQAALLNIRSLEILPPSSFQDTEVNIPHEGKRHPRSSLGYTGIY